MKCPLLNLMLIRIVAPHFVAGIEIFKISDGVLGLENDEYYNKCAPILKYMKEWSPYEIKQYCIKKGWGYYPIIKKEEQ